MDIPTQYCKSCDCTKPIYEMYKSSLNVYKCIDCRKKYHIQHRKDMALKIDHNHAYKRPKF
jgi:hypothetical protein